MPQYRYSNIEYTEMVRIYAKCDDNVTLACKTYREKYGRNVSHQTMLKATQKLRDFGSFARITGAVNKVRPRGEHFRHNPHSSIRKAAKQSKCSTSIVVNNDDENDDDLHPAQGRQVKEVSTRRKLDAPPRIIFCNWILDNSERNILWTNETVFNTAVSNHPNNRYFWARDEELPHLLEKFANEIETHKPDFALTVWGGIIGNIILGPVFFDKVNGDKYYKFLTENLPQLLEDVPLIYRTDMYFQHDGSPPHCVEPVKEFLNNEFENRWIGKEGPVHWPAASKDLSPVQFFLWKKVKQHVFKKEPENVTDLKKRVLEAFTVIRKTLVETSNSITVEINEKAMQCLKKWKCDS